MIDLEKILVKIVLLLVTALFIVLLFNSCKTHKQTIKTAIDSTATEVVKVESHTTDNSTTQEDYTEVTYVLDSVQSVIVNFGAGKVNYGSAVLKVKEIKVKNAHISEQKNATNKISANTEKTSEIEQNAVENKKEKPTTVKVLKVSFFFALLIILVFLLWRYTRH